MTVHYRNPDDADEWACGRIRKPTSGETDHYVDVTCRQCRGTPVVWDGLIDLVTSEIRGAREALDAIKKAGGVA